MDAAGWQEEKHHRDHGKFSSQSGSSGSAPAKSKVIAAPPHPGLGENYLRPKDIGINTVSGSVKAKINARILKQAPIKEFKIGDIEQGQGYLVKDKILKMIADPESLKKEVLTVAVGDGKIHLMDGNHRFAAMLLSGQQTLRARVVPAQSIKTYAT